jgi:hypothetical protein
MAKPIYARTEDKQISTHTSSAHDKSYWATQLDSVFACMSGCLYAILDWALEWTFLLFFWVVFLFIDGFIPLDQSDRQPSATLTIKTLSNEKT